MKRKYTQEQLENLIRCLNSGDFTQEITMDLLSSDELKEQYKKVVAMATDEDFEFSDEDMDLFDTFDDKIMEDFSLQIDIDQFGELKRIDETYKRAKIAT